MSAYQRNVLVGVVVLVGLGMLAWMVLQFANKAASFFLTSGTQITLTAAAPRASRDGSPITYKGVNVGRVTGVRRVASKVGGEDIVIDALIQADPPLPADLHGRIKQTEPPRGVGHHRAGCPTRRPPPRTPASRSSDS